jgi:Ca2+-dependent lipid-binding protein
MDMTGFSDPYVDIKFGNQAWKSNYVKQNLNPVWNELYNFDVESGTEVLECNVWDKDDFGKDDFLGKFSCNLENLRDQGQHDEWFDLEPDTAGKKWQGKVRLVLQFIHSKSKMLTGYINIWSEQLENEEMELKELKVVVKQMESPFGFIEGFTMEQKAKSRAEDRKD